MALLDEFKRFINVDATDTSSDTLYSELLARAEQKIASLFGGELREANYEGEKLDSETILFPKHYPIVSVEKLVMGGVELVEDTDFYVYKTYIYLIPANEQKKNITLDYTAGFYDIPEDIEQAIILTAANFLKINADLQPNQVVDTRLTREVCELLNPYLRFII